MCVCVWDAAKQPNQQQRTHAHDRVGTRVNPTLSTVSSISLCLCLLSGRKCRVYCLLPLHLQCMCAVDHTFSVWCHVPCASHVLFTGTESATGHGRWQLARSHSTCVHKHQHQHQHQRKCCLAAAAALGGAGYGNCRHHITWHGKHAPNTRCWACRVQGTNQVQAATSKQEENDDCLCKVTPCARDPRARYDPAYREPWVCHACRPPNCAGVSIRPCQSKHAPHAHAHLIAIAQECRGRVCNGRGTAKVRVPATPQKKGRGGKHHGVLASDHWAVAAAVLCVPARHRAGLCNVYCHGIHVVRAHSPIAMLHW